MQIRKAFVSLAVLATACVQFGAHCTAQEISFSHNDPWVKGATVRYTAPYDTLVRDTSVDYSWSIFIIGDYWNVYFAHWPDGCAYVTCAQIRHKVAVKERMWLDHARAQFVDRDHVPVETAYGWRHWRSQKQVWGFYIPEHRATTGGLTYEPPRPRQQLPQPTTLLARPLGAKTVKIEQAKE